MTEYVSARSKKMTATGIIYINKYECTIDQELAGAAAFAGGRRFVFIRQTAALHCVK